MKRMGCALVFLVLTLPLLAHATPVPVFTNPYDGLYNFTGAGFTWGEAQHSYDASRDLYSVGPKLGTSGGGEFFHGGPTVFASVNSFVANVDSHGDAHGGAYVLAGSIPDLGADENSLLIVGVLRSLYIDIVDSEDVDDGFLYPSARIRCLALFDLTYVSPLLTGWGSMALLDSNARIREDSLPHFDELISYSNLFGQNWTGMMPLSTYLSSVVPVDEPNAVLPFIAAVAFYLVSLPYLRRIQRRHSTTT